MQTLVTRNIRISVETQYWQPYSRPENSHYVFAYRICIENLSGGHVRLRRRCWEVTDSNRQHRLVEGQGVVGEQPLLAPNEAYTYTSWCQLPTPIGSMAGFYTMCDEYSGETFPVTVPSFTLQAPWLAN